MAVDKSTSESIGRWFLLWTTIGCIFALQLRWHYQLSWALSIFWGLADWYLWGLLALPIGKCIRHLHGLSWYVRSRILFYLVVAPVVVALHVMLTMIVGGIGNVPADLNWLEFLQVLYAKKLTLNLITYAIIIVVYERLSSSRSNRNCLLLARLGQATRLVAPDEIIRGEVCGNYVNLHTEDGVWPVRETLSSLLERLPAEQFVRTSRSDMVSSKQVRKMNSDARTLRLVLGNGDEVQVARRYHSPVRKALREYCTS